MNDCFPPPLPLTAAQLGIWLGQQLDLRSPRYNAAEYLQLSGAVDREALQAALRRCTREAEALRASIQTGGEQAAPVQVLSDAECALHLVDVSGEPNPAQAALHWMRRDVQRPLRLEGPSLSRHALLRTAADRHIWYHCAHHAVLDGFGFALVARRVAALYSAAVAGKPAPAATFGSLASVIEEDAAYRASEARSRDAAFWAAYMADAPPPPTLASAGAVASERVQRESLAFPIALKRQLEALARPLRANWTEAFVAVFSAFLARETGAGEVVLGLPMMQRMGRAAARVPSMVMNIVPLRVRVPHGASLAALTAEVHAQIAATRPHARYRYEDLRRDLGLVGGGRRLFGPVVNVMPFDHGFRFAGQYAAVHNLAAGPVEDLAVALSLHGTGRAALLSFDGDAAAYSASQLAVQLGDFIEFAARAIETPEQSVPGLHAPAAVRAAQRSVLEGEPLVEPPTDVLHAIEGWAQRDPARTAIEHAGTRVSFAELLKGARRVATCLRQRGVTGEQRVGVLLARGPEAVMTKLGIWMLGAAYLPLDVAGPRGRAHAILDDATPVLVVARAGDGELASERGVPVLPWEEVHSVGTEPATLPDIELQTREDRPAYVIYTSGSTGAPNGVVVSHGALAHFVAAARQRYAIAAQDRVLQFAPLHFDASVEEIFVSLCAGATLVIRPDDMLDSMQRFLQVTEREAISVLDLPTALWHELTFTLATSAATLPASVRVVIIGGEAALAERVRQWRGQVSPAVALLNTYGPTEATVVSTSAALQEATQGGECVPIGRPLPGTRTVVVDREGQVAALGDAGELHLVGPHLALGYHCRPEVQQQRFVTLRLADEEGGLSRAYRTGDRVRQRADGQLEFLGRVDEELKISGHRVHPREVEAALLEHAGVREVAVVAQARGELGVRLVAHVWPADHTVTPEALRAHAARMLIAAAVPASIVLTERLPRTTTGKIDRSKLIERAAPTSAAPALGATPLEQTLLGIWQAVLGRAAQSTADNFFDLGGQSLQTIQVANRLSVVLGQHIPVALLFRHPTVAGLASALARQDASLSRQDVEAILRADARLADGIGDAPINAATSAQKHAPGARCVLLTGATGFVGCHLLVALLQRTEARVVCLVRASDAAQAGERLRRVLAQQGLDVPEFEARVEPLAADLTLPFLGLSEGLYTQLTQRCDTVLHCGASVSLVRDYASVRSANVVATQELLRFAAEGTAKPFHHVSTLAAAVTAEAGELPEAFVDAAPALPDGYSQSKWVAERLVAAAQLRGMDVAVYRLGRVVGPAETAFVNAQDIFWRLLRAGLPSGLLPDLRVREPWTPVDFVAQAIVELMVSRASLGEVLNLAPESPVDLAEVFDWVEDYGYPLTRCSLADFRTRLGDTADASDAATLAFMDMQLAQSTGAAPPLSALPCTERTRRTLASHGFAFPAIDRRLVHRYLGTCVKTGLLPAPPVTSLGA